jgi:hypothetical protein
MTGLPPSTVYVSKTTRTDGDVKTFFAATLDRVTIGDVPPTSA